MADCPDCENSRCWGRCWVLPIVYPISQMWRFDYEHNYIKVVQLRPRVTKMVIGSINLAQGNRIMSSYCWLDEMQSTAAQFIQVRVHLVFLLSQIEIPRLQPFVIGADAVQLKNEVRDLGLVLDRDLTMMSHITGLVRTKLAEVCLTVSHAGRDSSSGAKFDPEPNRLLQCRLCRCGMKICPAWSAVRKTLT